MQRIHILPQAEAQKIAAGEVVESPAHVIKELIENSLDAGATHITIYCQDAGKQLIRIIDNGCGMSEADAQLSILAHATSKITRIDDLSTIATFGFRGEALASIAAVSNVTLITKEADAQFGTKIEIEAGTITSQEATSCNTGTELIIKDLLYTMPARKKFLKTSDTEWRAIMHVVHAFCITHKELQVKLFHNDKEVLSCPSAPTLQARVAQLRDYHYAQQMLTVHELADRGMRVHGIITNHQFARFDRSQFYFFVNSRLVKNQPLSKAVMKGYANVLPPGRFPAVYLFIDVAQDTIDVNIHPRKEEVQFLHPRMVENLIEKAVKTTLENSLSTVLTQSSTNITPQPTYMPENKSKEFFSATWPEPAIQERPQYMPPRETPAHPSAPSFAAHSSPMSSMPVQEIADEQITIIAPPHEVIAEPALESRPAPHYRIVGQYNATYIILEHDTGMLLIDQHAAHERILYELFSKRFADIASVPLLFPQFITLSKDDITLLEPHLGIFASLGITLDIFGNDRLSVQALPVHLKNQSIDDIVRTVVSIIVEHQAVEHETVARMLNEKIRAQMACKAAVKAGDTLTLEHMQQLIADLYATQNHLTCPHGRPTTWLISLHDIEKKFKRITG